MVLGGTVRNSSVKLPIVIGLVFLTASCAGGKKLPASLLEVSTGPDASRVALGQELQTPASYANLPAPDASAGNLSGAILVAADSSEIAEGGGSSSGGGLFSRLFGGLFN